MQQRKDTIAKLKQRRDEHAAIVEAVYEQMEAEGVGKRQVVDEPEIDEEGWQWIEDSSATTITTPGVVELDD